jgi:DhnA family fructose-bisphosphate aldolase class Ia
VRESRPDLGMVRELRAHRPGAVRDAAAARRRRPLLDGNGRLLLIAADHPARGALGVRGEPAAMADRTELLERLVLALSRPGVDGVLGTADVLEDLLLLGALEGKLVIGSMNRGGLAGASFELDDRFTGYDADTIARVGFDGGKMLCRIDLADPATVSTLESCARAVTGLAGHGLMAMVEPFVSRRVDGRVRNDLSTEAVVTSVAVASGLGATSAHTWLKLPVVAGMDAVMAATTLPTLLLGGDPDASPEQTYAEWEKALALPGVRGLVVGRTMLYPRDGDVAAAVDSAAALVHPAGEAA